MEGPRKGDTDVVSSREVLSRQQVDIDTAALLERAAWIASEGLALVADGVVRWANPALHAICALPNGELVGRPVSTIELCDRLDPGEPCSGPALVVDPERTDRRTHRLHLRRADGSAVAVAVAADRLQAIPGGAWVLHVKEIAARLRADEALRTSEERFRALADHAPIGVFLSDVGVRLAYVNPGFARVWGRHGGELEGDRWLDPIVDCDRGDVLAAVSSVLAGERADVTFRVIRPDGDVRTLEARFVPLVGVDRQCSFVGSVEDVTDSRAREAALAWQARHDALTGLPNRTELWERIHAHIAATDRPVSLLFFDLDDFKLVNDSLGHAAGDVLLTEVAERLRHAVRDGDLVARFGGDEFVVFCPRTSTEVEAKQIADRLLAVLREPVDLGTRQVRVTASAGVLVSTPDHGDTEALIRDADIAMYQAKSAGKARAALFDAGARRHIEHRLDVVSDLRRALAEGEVAVAYQPIVRHADRTVAGAEALLRYEHPVMGPLPADQVIEVAEASGCIDELGAYVLQRACADLVAWRERAQGWRPQYISVNLAASQLADPDFEHLVAAAVAAHGLHPRDLCLELTESQLMTDVNRAAEVLGRLAATGVRLAIDDFGTGYSSLAYLRRFPVSLVKIERSFVTDADDPFVAAIVEAVVSVTRALGGAVVAEGVETVEQLDVVSGLGCRLIQGYLFARPGPPEDLPLVRRLDHLGLRSATPRRRTA
jgi:diguanylate cyclase (GGDEF)-like protein/PAS domain S-box-containing protein